MRSIVQPSSHTDKQMQKTNDYSSVSKCSTSAAGYICDDFIGHFVARKVHRTPLINRGYYVREKSIQTILLEFLSESLHSSFPETKEGFIPTTHTPLNILVLGAGYDSLFFRLQTSHREIMDQLDLRYIEIDFQDVVQNKLANMQSEEKMFSLLQGFSEPQELHSPSCVVNSSISGQYFLAGMDLRENVDFAALCKQLDIDASAPTFILSEVVLTYLDDSHVSRLFSACSRCFPNSVLLNYEQIQPYDPFGVIMVQHFSKQGTPLMNVTKYTSAESHQRRFRSTGWSSNAALCVSEFWQRFISAEERERVDALEPFDEHEEFVEKCRHYVIALAANGSFSQAYLQKYQSTRRSIESVVSSTPAAVMPGGFALYGHASAVLNLPLMNGSVLCAIVIIGGVCATGEPKLTNESTSGICETVDIGLETVAIWLSTSALDKSLKRPLVHHSVMKSELAENCLIVVGGRTSPERPSTNFYAVDFGIDPLSGKITYSVQKGEKRALLNSESGCIRCQTVDLLEGNVSLALQSCRKEGEGALVDYLKCDLTSEGVGITQIPLSPGYPARFSSITRWGSVKVLMSGGWQAGAAISAVQVYNGDEWDIFCDLDYPRFGHTSHVVFDRFLIVIGGVSHLAEQLPDVTVIDLNSKNQRHFSLSFLTKYQRSDYMLFNHTSNVLASEDGTLRIWIFGGGGNCFSFGSHFNAHPLTLDVTSLTAAS